MFDLARLGGWAALPFFTDDLPTLEAQLDNDILPPPHLTFAALERCQPDDTTVVIIGQDPYHTLGKADGLAFSIPDDFGGKLDSLGNIFKELEADIGTLRTHTALHDWADQGVLLLNTALSVPPGQPKGHARIGWTRLVDQVLDQLADRPRAYLLWGGPARAYARKIGPDNLVLTAAHPSPLSCYRGFFGSRPFSKVNQWLIDHGEKPINWADP
ncbi:uracil-DNA glycosylase [Yoonia sp.]|uniref:uracil-DNA glycosylase n=1 Tax=Yoonia sp. TaxID=2212373 RepID=UPI0019D853DB|nr:uracil-DNA glycosylase [Yoonia sp.]MBE0413290.1 uracil-DNA glycosylase [Yoonia sp.]